MNLIETIFFVYLAFLVVEILNKLGHFPKTIKMDSWFPLPKAVAFGVSEEGRYGGMIVYVILFLIAPFINTTSYYLKLIGFVAWLMFIAHAIIGSINLEIPVRRNLLSKIITDEIPNSLWFIFIPLGIIAFGLFCSYYLLVANEIFSLSLNLPTTYNFLGQVINYV